MVGKLMVQVSANMPSLGVTSSSVPDGVGPDGQPAASFTDLLQAIVSGLDKGLGNLQEGTIIGADGKTVSSENLMELMQKFSNGKGSGSDKKSASGNSVTDALQQMMTQLQASFAQPVAFIAPYQSHNTSSSDTSVIAASGVDGGNSAGTLIAALESAIQKGDITKQSVINTSELPAAVQTAGKQLNMDSVPIARDTVVTDQSELVAAQDNAQTSGPNLELAAFSVAAQNNLTGNNEHPARNTADSSMLNTANSSVQSPANAAARNIANSSVLNTANTSMLNTANSSVQSPANAGAQNLANSSMLTTATFSVESAGNAATPNTANFSILNTVKASVQSAANAAALNTASGTAENTSNVSMPDPERGALNSLVKGLTGDLGIKEVSVTLNNQNKSVAGDTSNNTAFPPVTLQQTPIANDSQPAQETLPVNKLNELSEPIMKTLGSGEKSLLIKLSPPDMGTIEIRLKMENGVLTADFKVDSTAVKDLFSIAMPQIKNSIENSGIKTGNFFANLKDDRSSDGGRQQDTNQQQQRQQKEQKPSFFDFFA
jgi:flagellar hook-length control protein FliK